MAVAVVADAARGFPPSLDARARRSARIDVRCKKWLVNWEAGNRTDQVPEGGSTGAGVPLSSVLSRPSAPPPLCGGRLAAVAAGSLAVPAASR